MTTSLPIDLSQDPSLLQWERTALGFMTSVPTKRNKTGLNELDLIALSRTLGRPSDSNLHNVSGRSRSLFSQIPVADHAVQATCLEIVSAITNARLNL